MEHNNIRGGEALSHANSKKEENIHGVPVGTAKTSHFAMVRTTITTAAQIFVSKRPALILSTCAPVKKPRILHTVMAPTMPSLSSV